MPKSQTFIHDCKFQVIQLSTGENCYIDSEDFDKVSGFEWFLVSDKYAATGHSSTRMHHLILGLDDFSDVEVHHKDGNGLNNRKSNLQVLNFSDHQKTRGPQSNNKTSLKGVYWKKPQGTRKGKWIAQITFGGKRIHIGRFDTSEQAAKAYDEAAKKYFGEIGYLNYK